MQNAKLILKKTATLLALSASLTACSSGFRAPGVLQTQSSAIDADKQLPSDSLNQIQQGNDSVTQEQDPILSSSSNRNTSYKLPANTFETIRVRLLPILSRDPYDTFQNSQGVDTVSLANENGLVIKNLVADTVVANGTTVALVFSKKTLTIDGKTYPFTEQSQLGIFPRVAGSLTHIQLKINNDRLSVAKISVNKKGELPFRGIFLIRQITRTATKRLSAVTNWNLINYVALEDYVHAVVPSEIGADSPAEALKAQALASRTYAVREMLIARCMDHSSGACSARNWDVDPSTAYQSFIGGIAEKASTFPAIDATKDQVISYKGAPILAMYHASSGGETVSAADYSCKTSKDKANCETRYAAEYPYLVDKKDPFNGAYARFGHGVGLPQRSAQEMAKENHSASEIIAQYYPGSTIEQIAF